MYIIYGHQYSLSHCINNGKFKFNWKSTYLLMANTEKYFTVMFLQFPFYIAESKGTK
jgi:hypothetical protein